MAGARHGMCELEHGMAGARHGTVWTRHGHGMLCVNRPLVTFPSSSFARHLVQMFQEDSQINVGW